MSMPKCWYCTVCNSVPSASSDGPYDVCDCDYDTTNADARQQIRKRWVEATVVHPEYDPPHVVIERIDSMGHRWYILKLIDHGQVVYRWERNTRWGANWTASRRLKKYRNGWRPHDDPKIWSVGA